MLTYIIDFSLRYRVLVLILALGAAGAGVVSMVQLDIDAFPDTTPVHGQINTVAAALGPKQVEAQITAPIEQALSGLPRLVQLTSVSKYGYSQITVVFKDGTDLYFARNQITERLNSVQFPLQSDRPKLGPPTAGLG